LPLFKQKRQCFVVLTGLEPVPGMLSDGKVETKE